MTLAAPTLRILVVEDSADDARTMTAALHASGTPVDVSVVRRLDEALPALADDGYHALLLDLTLPDSAGLETVVEVCGRAPQLPVVVVTRNADVDLPARSLRAGAEDYVTKTDLDPAALLRTVTHAIERHRRTMDELDHARASAEPRAGDSSAPVDSAPDPALPLANRDPALFDALRTRYADALEVALDGAPYRGPDRARTLLDALAARLGAATATPRDVIELHMDAVAHRSTQVHPERAAAYTEEGRFALLEVLGRLATYYRSRYLSAQEAEVGAGEGWDGGRGE